MKNYRFISFTIIMLVFSLVNAQNQNALMSKYDVTQSAKDCCPDAGSLISGNADFANSDLRIEKPIISKNRMTGNYEFSAEVANYGDDCSHCSKIVVLLPAEVKVLSYSAVSGDGREFEVTQCFGMLTIDAGMMCPASSYINDKKVYTQRIKIKVETTDHTANVAYAGFAIFASSKTPDLKQKDNYWVGRK